MLKAAVGKKACGVARPSQPLVALRAVGGNVEEVALLAPDDVLLELVDEGLRGLELARRRAISEWTTTPVTASGVELAREAGHGHVAEAEEGEVRLEGLDAASLQRVFERGLRLAQVGGVEVPVLVEDLGVTEGDASCPRAPAP